MPSALLSRTQGPPPDRMMMAKNSDKMSWDEIQRECNAEIDAARHYIDMERAPDRTKRWDRYYGRPYGNEMAGRSKYLSRDLLEAVEWTLPYVIRQFASGDPKVEISIEGQESWVGTALMLKIQDDLNSDRDESLFRAFYEWFKDAMVSDTGFLKLCWALDYEDKPVSWPQLGIEHMNELANDPDVQIRGFEEQQGPAGELLYSNVKAKVRSIRRNNLVAIGLPHWEFICSPDCKTVNDEHPKGHQTPCSLDYLKRINRARGGNYFQHLEEFERPGEEDISKRAHYDPMDGGTTERQSYRNETDTLDAMPEKGGRRSPLLTEWFTRLDINGDGYLEDVVCWVADRRLIRYEDNSEGMIPICALSPILDCYKMFGISFSDLIVPIQNLKSMLTRRILDNFDFSNLGIWISKDPSIDMRKLLSMVPGDLVRGDPATTQRLSPEPFHPSILALLEYVDSVKENRIGNTAYNQGTDAETLNKTARGIEMIMGAAHQRMELIARIFAETGLKDFYFKAAELYQIYQRQPFTAQVKGVEVQVSPEQLQGRLKVRVSMGVEAEVGMIEASKIKEIFGFLVALHQVHPGAVGLQQAHNLATRFVASMGYRDTDSYVPGLKDWATQIKQMMEMQQQAVQAQAQAAQAELGIKEGQLRLQAAKAQGDLETADRQMTIDEQKAELDARLKLLGTMKDERPQVII